MNILNDTVSALQSGIQNLAIQRAAQTIEAWTETLSGADLPGAERLTANLQALYDHLLSESVDGATVAGLLSDLAADTQRAAEGAAGETAEQVQLLGRLLSDSAEGLNR